MSTSCRTVVHTSVGPTKNCARWVIDDTTQQPVRRGPSWFKNNPGTHQVILTDCDAPPPDTTAFQPDAQLSEGAVACTIVGGKTSGRRGRATRQHYPNPDLTSPGVQALIYSPYDGDRRGFLAAHHHDFLLRLRYASWSLDNSQLDAQAEKTPWEALEFSFRRLSQQRLRECALQEPKAAFLHAVDALTPDLFDTLVERYPAEALAFASHRLSRTQIENCAQLHPKTALGYVPDRLPPAVLRVCAGAHPREALIHARHLLPFDLMKDCAEKEPAVALQYATDEMPATLLDTLADKSPREALQFASHRLSDVQFHTLAQDNVDVAARQAAHRISPTLASLCALQHPEVALEMFPHRLSQYQLDECAFLAPDVAFQFASDLLSGDQVGELAQEAPWEALEFVPDRLSTETFNFCVEKVPDAALEFVPGRLSQTQLNFCVESRPGDALAHAGDYLSAEQIAGCFSSLKKMALPGRPYGDLALILPGFLEKVPSEKLAFVPIEVLLASAAHRLGPLDMAAVSIERPTHTIFHAGNLLSWNQFNYCLQFHDSEVLLGLLETDPTKIRGRRLGELAAKIQAETPHL